MRYQEQNGVGVDAGVQPPPGGEIQYVQGDQYPGGNAQYGAHDNGQDGAQPADIDYKDGRPDNDEGDVNEREVSFCFFTNSEKGTEKPEGDVVTQVFENTKVNLFWQERTFGLR